MTDDGRTEEGTPAGRPYGYAADIGRLPAHTPPLDAGQQQRVDLLLAGTVISLHDHPVRLPEPLRPDTWSAHAAGGVDRVGTAGLRASGLNVVLASALAEPDQGRLLAWAKSMSDQLRTADALATVTSWPGARALSGQGLVLALEDLGSVGTDLSGIEELYTAGYRSAGLAYNTGNPLAGGLAQPDDPGLSALGRRAVTLMNSLGMLVDLAHVGDRASLEAAEATGAPVVISHAGARALWPSRRMKPDEVLRSVAATGGVIGVEAAPGSTRIDGRPDHDLDAVMAHVTYIADLVGVDHVGLGPDTFFGDHAGLYAAAGWRPQPVPGREGVQLPDYVRGMENPAEAPRNAASWLVAHGWRDEDIAKVLGGNAARVLASVL
jgi:membrane dipeptidase